jgi:hypothetical protein
MSRNRSGGFIVDNTLSKFNLRNSSSAPLATVPATIKDFDYTTLGGMWNLNSTYQFPNNNRSYSNAFSILGVGGGPVTSVDVSSWQLLQNDVLFCFSATDGSSVNLPTGFTNGQNGDNNSIVWRWSFKIVGSIPDTAVSGLTQTGNIVFGIRGIDVSGGTILAEAAGSIATGSGHPNPPSRTLSSRNDAMVLGFGSWDNGDGWAASVTPPSGYTLIGAQNGNGRDSVVTAAYLIASTTGTYDPGAFSASSTESWMAQTLFLKL